MLNTLLCRTAFVVAISVGAIAHAEAWELRNGNWTPVKAPTTQPETDPTLERVETLLLAYEWTDAKKLALSWEKTHKTSPLRDRCIFQIARAFFGYGDRIKAFYYCDELMDEYPESKLFYSALQMQYDIADAYLNGYKRRFMKMPIVGASEEAIDMLFRIQQRSPGSPLAEKSLLRTADFYFAKGDYDLAGDAYTEFVRSYGRSPVVPRVRLRNAYSSLAQFRGLRYDATPLLDARTQLQAIIVDYPQMAEEENLHDLIDRIDTTFARKNNVVADFYKRTHVPEGAAYTYRYVETTYPGTPEAAHAAAEMKKLPPAAVAASMPQGMGPLLPNLPTTQGAKR